VGKVLLFDIQGWITLILGGLRALITLFSSYSHVHIPILGSAALDQQVGVLLLVAVVPGLNWRAVVGCELREIEFERSEREHEQRMQQLESEIAQIESENARLAEHNAKLSAISSSSGTNSCPTNPTPNESEM
jgi:hypothetical protein